MQDGPHPDGSPAVAIPTVRQKRGRLSRSAEFDRVYRQGKSYGGQNFVLHVFPRDAREAAAVPRLGLSVSKRVGNAVERNRVKRLVREAFGQLSAMVPADLDVVVVARGGSFEAIDRGGIDGVRSALRELLDKAALTTGSL